MFKPTYNTKHGLEDVEFLLRVDFSQQCMVVFAEDLKTKFVSINLIYDWIFKPNCVKKKTHTNKKLNSMANVWYADILVYTCHNFLITSCLHEQEVLLRTIISNYVTLNIKCSILETRPYPFLTDSTKNASVWYMYDDIIANEPFVGVKCFLLELLF